MKRQSFLVLIIVSLLVWPLLGQAYFYRTDSSDTSFRQGIGINGSGQTDTGMGYNIEPLANYGYTPAEAQPRNISINNINKDSVTVSWTAPYMSRAKVYYGVGRLNQSTTLLYWQQGRQNNTLSGLICGTTYHYQVALLDAGGNEQKSANGQFKTLSCQTNFLDEGDFAVISNNGRLELTPDIAGKTTLYESYQHQITLGLPQGAVNTHADLQITSPYNNYPATPSIASGLFTVYEQPWQLSLQDSVTGEDIEQFNARVTVSISFADRRLNNFASDTLRLAYYDDEIKQWLVLPTTVDINNSTARADIYRLGYYRLLASVPGWEVNDVSQPGIYKMVGDEHIYWVENNIRHLVSSSDILHSWSAKPVQAQVNSKIYRLPRGENLKFRDGSVVKVGAATYYFISDGGKRIFMTTQLYNALGFSDDWAYRVGVDSLADYPEQQAITDATTKPDGVLIKYAGDPRVYLLDNGHKRWISSEAAFNTRHYRWDRIITVPVFEIYPDGDLID
ncbi:MAG: fibronectin type III domain-containing protein [Candidatus Komeilibacteria bacterium]